MKNLYFIRLENDYNGDNDKYIVADTIEQAMEYAKRSISKKEVIIQEIKLFYKDIEVAPELNKKVEGMEYGIITEPEKEVQCPICGTIIELN